MRLADHVLAGNPMPIGKDELIRIHAGALNGHDPESVMGHYHPGVRCIRDGCLVGEGRDAVRKAFLEEFALNEELVGRVMEVDGEPVVVEWAGPEGREAPRAIVRLEAQAGRVTELRIERDARTVRRVGIRPFT
jgi:hypothetical protein